MTSAETTGRGDEGSLNGQVRGAKESMSLTKILGAKMRPLLDRHAMLSRSQREGGGLRRDAMR